MGGLLRMSLTFGKLADSYEWVMPGSSIILSCVREIRSWKVSMRYWNKKTVTALEPHETVCHCRAASLTHTTAQFYSPLSALIFVLGTGP